jgi:hypothetical protein
MTMRNGYRVAALASILIAGAALADLAPIPDKGPPIGDAGGLSFTVQSVEVEMGPANGPHYKKAAQVVVLTGCAEGTPNCTLARAKAVVGMEVVAVDGMGLMPEKGMVRQILDAFADPKAPATIGLTLYAHAADSKPVEVRFARR